MIGQNITTNSDGKLSSTTHHDLLAWVGEVAELCLIQGYGLGRFGFSKSQFLEIMGVDREAWKKELHEHEELFASMYDKLPKEFIFVKELLLSALWRSPVKWGLQPEVV